MSLSLHWKRRHEARLAELLRHMRLSYDELQHERRPVKRHTENLCSFVRRMQSVHDDWHEFLKNHHLMQLKVVVPANERHVCSHCVYTAETFRQFGVDAYLDKRKSIPPPILGGVRR